MSDISMQSVMFEEIKQALKRIENQQNEHNNQASSEPVSDELVAKLNQFESSINRIQSKRVRHSITIDIRSSWVVLTIIGLAMFLGTSLALNYKQNEQNKQLVTNDMMYRYIKMQGEISASGLLMLEELMESNVKAISKQVQDYEKRLRQQVKMLEQARLREAEAQQLKQEAEKLK